MSDAIYTRRIKIKVAARDNEVATVTVHPLRLEWRLDKGWQLVCWDHDKQATKAYALADVQVPEGQDRFVLLMLHPDHVAQGEYQGD